MLVASTLVLMVLSAQSGSGWRLAGGPQDGPTGAVKLQPCSVVSPITTLDKDGDPTYGALFLVVTDNSALSMDGSRIGAYFNGLLDVTVRVGSDSQKIGVRKPVEAKGLLAKMEVPEATSVSAFVRFKEETYKHRFSLAGFRTARAAAAKCLSASASASFTQNVKGSFTLEAFLQSPIARKYGISKAQGWPVSDGVFNNKLKAAQEPELSIDMGTRNGQVVGFGIVVPGAKRPDSEQIALVNDILGWASATLGGAAPSLRPADFAKELSVISDAPPRQFGRLRLRSGWVLEPVLSVEIRP